MQGSVFSQYGYIAGSVIWEGLGYFGSSGELRYLLEHKWWFEMTPNRIDFNLPLKPSS